ncbi:unnamed protein product [Pleuronectes platessa]|uniref:Uncharacterized protein n=1 Tax=Pleuronectes platessa TaxID=8262 RepID=A0A9N7VL12_PLEPL|nr:unnamed protein product [Pleuronectes platessa]
MEASQDLNEQMSTPSLYFLHPALFPHPVRRTSSGLRSGVLSGRLLAEGQPAVWGPRGALGRSPGQGQWWLTL